MQHFDIAIVGAGHAGAQTAIALRQQGFAGSLALIGAEAELPYERPPLSKDFLAGDKPFERMLLRPRAFWDERGVVLRLGTRVTRVATDAHRLETAAGEQLGYGRLVWATGGTPRRLAVPGAHLAGQHVVRTAADVVALKADLAGAARVVVVGGGYIGLETAAVLAKQGRRVTVLEAMPRLLARVAGAAIGDFYAEVHRAHGVEVLTGVEVVALEGHGRVEGVVLADGRVVPADLVILGIGIVPEIGPLAEAGAELAAGGVLVDAQCRTSLPDIWAVGDAAAHASRFAGGAVIRLESVQNANDMATTVARDISGQPQPYAAVPWFWSNQYDLRLQTVGLAHGHDATVLRGDPAARSFALIYLRQRRVIALDCVNATRDYVQGRALVERGAEVPPELLADPAVALKAL